MTALERDPETDRHGPGVSGETDRHGPGVSFEELAGAVDRAVARVDALDGESADVARELQGAIEAFHRPVLVAIVRALRDDERGKELLFELVDDPHVRAVLSLHGIIRAEPPAPAPAAAPAMTETLIPIDSIRRRTPAEAGWVPGPPVDDVPHGGMLRCDLDGAGADGRPQSFVITRIDDEINVFRNACIHQGLNLDGGTIDDGVLRCPWHGFIFDAATGACHSSPGGQLDMVPHRIDQGHVWLRPGHR